MFSSLDIIPNFALTAAVVIREEIFMSTNKVVANALLKQAIAWMEQNAKKW